VQPTQQAAAPAAAEPAPAAAPAAPQGVPVQAAQAAPVVDAGWARAVSGWLQSHRTYPDEARRRGEEGHVALRFTVDRTGKVLDVELVHGSASQRLDDAALDLLRHATLPPFAATMTAERVTITMQIRYTLTQ
jgi:periplasmic protein TonB